MEYDTKLFKRNHAGFQVIKEQNYKIFIYETGTSATRFLEKTLHP